MIACLPSSPGYASVRRIAWMISLTFRSYGHRPRRRLCGQEAGAHQLLGDRGAASLVAVRACRWPRRRSPRGRSRCSPRTCGPRSRWSRPPAPAGSPRTSPSSRRSVPRLASRTLPVRSYTFVCWVNTMRLERLPGIREVLRVVRVAGDGDGPAGDAGHAGEQHASEQEEREDEGDRPRRSRSSAAPSGAQPAALPQGTGAWRAEDRRRSTRGAPAGKPMDRDAHQEDHRRAAREACGHRLPVGARRQTAHLDAHPGRYPRGGPASGSAGSRRPGFGPRITAPRRSAGSHCPRTGNRAVGRHRTAPRGGGQGRHGADGRHRGVRRDVAPTWRTPSCSAIAASRLVTRRAGDVRQCLRVAPAVANGRSGALRHRAGRYRLRSARHGLADGEAIGGHHDPEARR